MAKMTYTKQNIRFKKNTVVEYAVGCGNIHEWKEEALKGEVWNGVSVGDFPIDGTIPIVPENFKYASVPIDSFEIIGD